jgi:hypothetical protein
MVTKILRILLILLDAFLGITAVAGGIGLLTGTFAPGPEFLEGSIFKSFTIPGLALMLIVGGGGLLAAFWLLRRHPWGLPASLAAGIFIILFEIVEILVIGSPPGISRMLQIFYISVGLLIIILTALLWLGEPQASRLAEE